MVYLALTPQGLRELLDAAEAVKTPVWFFQRKHCKFRWWRGVDWNISKIYIFFLLIPAPAFAASWFGYIVNHRDVPVFAGPAKTARIVETLPVTYKITGDIDAASYPGWVGFTGMGKGKVWVRRTDLTIFSDMKRVVGCWPFKRVEPGEGEWTYDSITFQANGAAGIEFSNGNKEDARTFMHNELIGVRAGGSKIWLFLGFRMQPLALQPEGEPGNRLELFKKHKLAKCEKIRTR